VELALDAPETVPAILVDEGRMLQVLKNLVDNALRYTPEKGRIRLGAVAGSSNMGLGLAICKALVTAQGGEISAESAGIGQGTTMVITFTPSPAA
jgi:signal transduction histidine kinase